MEEKAKNPNPTKDQHFMIDKGIIDLIYDTVGVKNGESILEIGGGEGALTDCFINGNNNITVIELDPYYANFLKEKYKDNKNVTIIEGNALGFNYNDYDRIVSNLPYTITEPFLINLAKNGTMDYDPSIPNGSMVKSVTIVLSQNSLRKMVSPVQITEGDSKHMNSEFGHIGAISKSLCDIDIVSAIPSEAFFPEPAVTSFLINLTPKKEKTTVDRIMAELLLDKKNTCTSIKRTFQLMLAKNKIYKVNKNSSFTTVDSNFTSKVIQDKNIYDLSNGQLSQLVVDLIRNDIKIKSSKRNSSNVGKDYTDYLTLKNISIDSAEEFKEQDYEDDLDYDEIPEKGIKDKFKSKYDYMYEANQYEILLNRGLEYLNTDELKAMLGKEKGATK